MDSGTQFLYCIPVSQEAKLRTEHRRSYVVGHLDGRPADSQETFLASMRQLPMDPPARKEATRNIDALIDSCFGGLMAFAPAQAAVFWPYADSTKRSILRFGVELLHTLACITASAEPEGVDLKLFLVCASPEAAAELDNFLGQDPSLRVC